MSEQWAKLAEPFDPSEVKQRPGRGGMTFSYVDARAVMQRLDDVVTPGGWDFNSSVLPGTDIVHGVLTIGGSIREDYGYPNSDQDEEPIKAASSDALKRCAVMFGIGRHLYSDNTQSSGRGVTSSSPRPPARPTVVRSSTEMPEMPPNEWDEPAPRPPLIKDYRDAMGRTPPIVDDSDVPQYDFAPIGSGRAAMPGDECPDHPGVEWRGEPGDLYHGPKPYHRHPDNIRKARGA